ncbi:MAG: prolipoprotein diacylglyceryl transferase [Gammaproteobacteria bacterium]|jgi:phosphatidylglycerol---prolipoprotein diacylglyceryl transferase
MLYPEIDPVALQIGAIKIHWYGVSYMVAFIVGWWLARVRARQTGLLDNKGVDDLVFYVVLGVIIGGRVGYILFYSFGAWMSDPLELFRVWEGGMSFHGGLLGVLVAVWLFARKINVRFFQVTDFIAPLIPVGLFTGRIGNFINGELWGAPTSMPWGMQVKCEQFYYLCTAKLGLPAGTELTPPLHPSQLYEALLEGVVLFALLWLVALRKPATMLISGLFLIGYSAFRFTVEFVRMPDAHIGYLWGEWLTMGQVLSLPMFAAGLVIAMLAYKPSNN